MNTPLQDDAEFLEEAHELLREAQRYCRRRTWRRNVLLRSTRVALTLHAIEKSLDGSFARRIKDPSTRTWSVYARTTDGEQLVAVVGGGPTKTLEDLRAPVRIEIIAADFFDLELLARLTGASAPAVAAGLA